MELGNWLATIFVFVITITLIRKLFAMLEGGQEALQQARGMKAALEEREKMARDLHDGISQSLFLLSVKLDRLEEAQLAPDSKEQVHNIRKTIRRVYDDVRQAIAGLRTPPAPIELQWSFSLQSMIEVFQRDTGVAVKLEWLLPEEALSFKDKVDLFAILREALLNVQKHAKARRVWIRCETYGQGWVCSIEDDGVGYSPESQQQSSTFGVSMMKERAEQAGWRFELARIHDRTVVKIRKEESR